MSIERLQVTAQSGTIRQRFAARIRSDKWFEYAKGRDVRLIDEYDKVTSVEVWLEGSKFIRQTLSQCEMGSCNKVNGSGDMGRDSYGEVRCSKISLLGPSVLAALVGTDIS